jgi:hypothetical protein
MLYPIEPKSVPWGFSPRDCINESAALLRDNLRAMQEADVLSICACCGMPAVEVGVCDAYPRAGHSALIFALCAECFDEDASPSEPTPREDLARWIRVSSSHLARRYLLVGVRDAIAIMTGEEKGAPLAESALEKTNIDVVNYDIFSGS